jgi:riboflavin synthase
MFTGIIEEVGRISAVRDLGGGRRISVEAKMVPELHPDQSISINGACQTVVEVGNGRFDVIAVEETLRKTTFGLLSAGDLVNLERAMSPTGRLDGHIVQGHVDTTGTITAIEQQQTGRLYSVRFPDEFSPYVIPVGSIAIDGISLTVARLRENELTVAIIPYTYDHTNVPEWKVGKKVNLEFDLIGKYVARWLSVRGGKQEGITESWLREQGF